MMNTTSHPKEPRRAVPRAGSNKSDDGRAEATQNIRDAASQLLRLQTHVCTKARRTASPAAPARFASAFGQPRTLRH